MSTPHDTLGVSPEATDDEIRAAYKRAAMKHHPDRGGSPEAFQAVRDAYVALTTRVCPDCKGKGFTHTRQGIFVSKTRCPRCWKS